MRKFFILPMTLFFVGCSEQQITEVGNPTNNPAPTKVEISATVASAIGRELTGVLGAVNEEEQMMSFECSFEENGAGRTMRCDCPGGGSIQIVMEESDSLEEGGSFSSTFTETFDDCILSACGADFRYRGTLQGAFAGSCEEGTFLCQFTMVENTAEGCSGLVVDNVEVEGDDVAFGMELNFSIASGGESFQKTGSGSLCVAGEEITFESHDQLQDLADPEGQCTEDFESFGESGSGDDGFTNVNECEDCFQECFEQGGEVDACIESCRSQGLCE